MKSTFAGYYRPSQDEFKNLWDSAQFSFDASVLLDLYRFTEKTSDQFLGILESLSDRLWLTHQAGLEFVRNRPKVIEGLRHSYSSLGGELKSVTNEFESKILNSIKRHPLLPISDISTLSGEFFNKMDSLLKDSEAKHPNLLVEADRFLESVFSLFRDKTGKSYEESRIDEIVKSGEVRYPKGIPPGFEDAKRKKDDRKYGDLVLWHQLIDYAKETKKPVIFVTDDTKEDWWWRVSGKTLGPHPQLIQEFLALTGQSIYIYSPESFLEQASKYLDKAVGGDVLKEVREVERLNPIDPRALCIAELARLFVDEQILGARSRGGQSRLFLPWRQGTTDPIPNPTSLSDLDLDSVIREQTRRSPACLRPIPASARVDAACAMLAAVTAWQRPRRAGA